MTTAGFFGSALTFVIGLVFFLLPEQAARLWGQKLSAGLPNRKLYRRMYRAAGLLLCLAAVLVAAETWFYREPPPPVMRIPPPFSITRLTALVVLFKVKV